MTPDRDPDDRYNGLPYDELLDEHGRQIEFVDIDDVVSQGRPSGLEGGRVRYTLGMDVTEVMAQIIVTDLERSTAFYEALFGRPPDANPMAQLHEWHFAAAGAVQVFQEPDRAGRSGATLHVADLDAAAVGLDAAGIDHDPIAEADYVRIVVLADPDGNRIVLAGEK